jgi:transposase
MYVKKSTVRQGERTYVYLRLVESYRDEAGKVRHRTVAKLGREDELKASGQLDQLAGSFARLDPPMTGTRRDVGGLLLVEHYLRRLGLAKIVERVLPERRRSLLSAAEVITALVANRLAGPAPLYDIAGWASSAAVAELFGIPPMLLNDDRLGRVLDDFCPVAEGVRGEVALAAISEFGLNASRLHLDLTTLRMAGHYDGSALVAEGWGPDRRVARQVRVLSATTPGGVALYTRPHPGNAHELTCLGAAMQNLRDLLPPGLLVVADSALGHIRNLAEAHRAGLRFLAPLRASTGFADRYLTTIGPTRLRPINYVSRRESRLPVNQRTHYRGTTTRETFTDPATGEQHTWTVAYIHSSEEATSVAAARERALTKAETALTRIHNGLGRRYYATTDAVTKKLGTILPAVDGLLHAHVGTTTDAKPTLTWKRDQTAINAAAQLDGIYAIATNLPGRPSATRILTLYKDQHTVETAHRNNKGTLRVRPIFLHNDERITALVSIVGIALTIFGLIELDLRQALTNTEHLPGLLPEGRAARPTGRNILATFQGLGATYTPHGIRLDRLTTTQRQILNLLNITPPWPEQDT